MTIKITDPIDLPCGTQIRNRLCKAAMTEGLADSQNRATERHLRLYEFWQQAGVGLSLTGNILIDRRNMERAGNVAVDGNGGDEAMQKWTKQVTADGTQFWAQIAHAGRQSPAAICDDPVAPSAIGLQMPGAEFNQPHAASEAEIKDLIRRFAHTAETCKRNGFTGIQIHGAHGYLLSSFLSPLSNQRTDQWGGSLENRARIHSEVMRACREAVGRDFPIALKLNSADFQKGGFTEEESLQVLNLLDAEALDLVEISGGNYESTAVLFGDKDANGNVMRESTIKREAYFIEYAKKARQAWHKPLMITGGVRSREAMEQALNNGELDLIGIGRPMVCNPESVGALLSGSVEELVKVEDRLVPVPAEQLEGAPEEIRLTANTFGHLGWFYMNLFLMGDGKAPMLDASLADALHLYPPMEAEKTAKWDSPWKS